MGCGRGHKPVHGQAHHPPQPRSTALTVVQGDRDAHPIAGLQAGAAAWVRTAEAAHDEMPLPEGHHKATRPGVKGAVDHHQIAIPQTIPPHGLPLHAHQDGGEG